MKNKSAIQSDFDRLAIVSEHGWDHNSHYHDFLLKHLPPRLEFALDIGCGVGAFSRRLAERANHVLGLDLSPEMIRIAREQSAQHANIDYQIIDVMANHLPDNRFDCIASIATLHHLPFERILSKAKCALRPGGTLLVLDLFQDRTFTGALINVLALPANIFLRPLKTGRLRESAEVRAAWTEHGRHDHYMTLPQIRQVCAAILPGAKITRHLFWRYSTVWRKKGQS